MTTITQNDNGTFTVDCETWADAILFKIWVEKQKLLREIEELEVLE